MLYAWGEEGAGTPRCTAWLFRRRHRILNNLFSRVAALPAVVKVLVVVAALVLLGISVVLSPLLAILATLVLIVAVDRALDPAPAAWSAQEGLEKRPWWRRVFGG
jgi:hypothetical protein